jgi:CHAT domain-containing protein
MREFGGLIGDARLNGNAPRFNEVASLARVNELSPVLSHLLLEPIRSQIETASKVYFVPQREFDWLPFHTLRSSGGSPLGVKVPVCYLPTAAALLFKTMPPKYIENVLGLGFAGNSGWDVAYELKDIRSFYEKAKVLLDSTASLSRIMPLSYDLLHVAAEFNLNAPVPDRTAATLSDGVSSFGMNQVPLGQLMSAPMPQVLIFSNVTQNPGGLSRYLPMAFLANGVRTVITTMWQGERKSKKYFGEVFYTNVMSGTPANNAYQLAIQAMNKNTEFSRPNKWGLYYCFGR